MKLMKVKIDGVEESVFAEKVGSTIWYHWQGETFSYTPEIKKRKGLASGNTQAGGALKAPMPGKIVSCFSQEGQTVEQGQVIVVMEAMKMEYKLEAPFHGVLKEVFVKEGESVQLGQTLAVVEKEGENES